MKILESSENYLETIYMINKRKGNVRSIDIANELNFSKASVSVAMKLLRENEFIQVGDNGNITLLDKGLEIATKMYNRHVVLTNALVKLGVDEKVASDDACKIEHVISDETYNAIKSYLDKWRMNSEEWIVKVKILTDFFIVDGQPSVT